MTFTLNIFMAANQQGARFVLKGKTCFHNPDVLIIRLALKKILILIVFYAIPLAICLSSCIPCWSFPPGSNLSPSNSRSKTASDIKFKSHDGHELFGRLVVPKSGNFDRVVVYVQDAQGSTIEMKRHLKNGEFVDLFEMFSSKLSELGVALFLYEGRGIRSSSTPPRFQDVEWKVYNSSTLENKARDVLSAIRAVKDSPGVDNSKIFLLGCSEGSLIAAEAASLSSKEIDGLILGCVMSMPMKETMSYVLSEGAFLPYRHHLDSDGDGKISKKEFDLDPTAFRKKKVIPTDFGEFDANGDGLFSVDDFRLIHKELLTALDKSDFSLLDRWARASLDKHRPQNWFKDHFEHKSIWSFLEDVKIPVGIFHGELDSYCSVAPVKRVESEWKKAGKTNRTFRYFENLDHSLGLVSYFEDHKVPASYQAMFEFIKNQVRK